MHVLMVIAAGFLALGAFLLFGRHWGGDASGLALAAKIFVPAWFLLACANLWIGVAKAGYTMREELPILLLVFAVPAAVAGVVAWHLSRS